MKTLLRIVLFVLPAMLFAQSPFDGTWKTNMSQSKLSQKPVIFSVNSGMYNCDSCVPKISIKADGQEQSVAAPGRDYDTLVVKVVDANSIQVTGKKSGKSVYEQTRTVSPDGNTLTIANTNFSPDGGKDVKAEVKWARVSKGPAGSNGTSGSWRLLTVNEDEAGLTSTWKSSGDGLTWSSASGESWEAKLDGKEYPVKGVFANETVSLKQTSDRSIEATYKRDGKLYTVEKISISPDGKKMTTIVDNKILGRVSTYVDDKQ